MRLPIRPGKLSCAGIVAIMMVLPNSIWRGPDAKIPPPKAPSTANRTTARAQVGRAWNSGKCRAEQSGQSAWLTCKSGVSAR
jgi:hypothetical protein